jgi:predicted outer membrane protein
LERSQSDQVKEFARVVIEDHKKADQELAKILQANNINYRAGTFESGRGEEMGTVGGTAGSTPLGTDSGKKILENDPYSPANQNRRRSAVDVDRAKTETPIATQLASDQQELINRLQLLSGPQFDGVFMEAMVTNHQQSVQMHEELIRTSDNNQIRDYASRQLPILREHLQTAQNLQRAAMNAGAGQN